jgi:FdhE protein
VTRYSGAGRSGPEPPDILELRRLRETQPDLASAIDLQIELVKLERRVRGRVPIPALDLAPPRVHEHLTGGQPLLRFSDIPLNWSDFRFLFRSVAELMRRHDALDERDYRRAEALAREGHQLEPVVVQWFMTAVEPASATPLPEAAGLEPVVQLAMRPFLMRCAEVCSRTDFAPWTRGCCPLCGGEPEFAVITPAAEHLLVCGRCTTRWPFDALTCPYCGNDDRSRLTSFASRDGLYRITACDVCRHYVKAFDGRHADRPLMLEVDSIATLPLDAAALQRGYQG